MELKRTRVKIGTFAILAVCMFVGLLFFAVPNKSVVTVHAASAAVLTVQGRFEGTGGTPMNGDNPSDYIKVTIQPSAYSGTGTIKNNEALNWTYMTAKVEIIDTKRFKEHFQVQVIKDDIEVLTNTLSGKSDTTLFSTALTDGNYSIRYRLNISLPNAPVYKYFEFVFDFTNDLTPPKTNLIADGKPLTSGSYTNKGITFSASDPYFKYIYYKKPSASTFSTTTNDSYYVDSTSANTGWWEFYAADSLGNSSDKVKAFLDCTPPTLSCSSGVSFGGTTGKSFTISATDSSGTAKLYIKYESEEWFSNSKTSHTVAATEKSGRYYFYAEDGCGNISDTKWVILSTDEPIGRMVKSESDNSISFLWDSDYWSATLDGRAYNNGTWIATEGNHTLILNNNAGKTKTYNFFIDHYYVQTSITESACNSNGSAKYECLQCGDVKNEVIFTKGHQYRVETIPASCLSQGESIYTCTVCGDTYRETSGLPSGHSFTSKVIRAATCTQEGLRRNTCDLCGETTQTAIAAQGHSYEITDVKTTNKNTVRTYTCSVCRNTYKQELGNQYEEVSNYVEYLFNQYSPYMVYVLIATAGLWSIAIGIAIIIAHKNEDKEKARRMLINYAIGLVVIFVIIVACPYLIRGIAALVT